MMHLTKLDAKTLLLMKETTSFDFVTYNAARALRLPDYGLEPGCKADLNVLATSTAREVLRLQQPLRWVMREGNVLARNQVQREFVGQ